MKKRLMALLLVLCMVLGMFPTTASAADAQPNSSMYSFTMQADGNDVELPMGKLVACDYRGTQYGEEMNITVPADTKTITLSSDSAQLSISKDHSTDFASAQSEITFDYDPAVEYYCLHESSYGCVYHLYIEEEIPTTYGITVSESENGTVTADKAEAKEGETVTLTVTPAEGYELDTLTVTDADGAAVTVTDNTFVMPAKAVMVSATFKTASPKVVLKLEGYEVMADAASVTLSGEDCNFLDSNGIYTAMMPSTNNKVDRKSVV